MNRFDIVPTLSDALSLHVDVSALSDAQVLNLVADLNAVTMGVLSMRKVSPDKTLDVFVDTTGWSPEAIKDYQMSLLQQAGRTIEHISPADDAPLVAPIYAADYRIDAAGDRVCWERGSKDKVCWERGGKK